MNLLSVQVHASRNLVAPRLPVAATSDILDRVFSNLDRLVGPNKRIGLAVSGGGDSVALYHLCRAWGRAGEIHVAIVDHQLRDTAAVEIEFVEKISRADCTSFSKLVWEGWDGSGNLQSSARDARRILLADWAEEFELDCVLLGHNSDDVAETFLMRLARGSGVDGLSAMKESFSHKATQFYRPLLEISRFELRDYLNSEGLEWCEDPSNDDERFDRIQIRKNWEQLEAVGLTRDRLIKTARSMSRAKTALDSQTQLAVRQCAKADELGYVILELDKFEALSEEIQTRILAHSVWWITGDRYRPRYTALFHCLTEMLAGRGSTVNGCQIVLKNKDAYICREANAAKSILDDRWFVADGVSPVTFDPDGVGNWRELAPRKEILATVPTVTSGKGQLSPIPKSVWGQKFALIRPAHEFLTSIVTH